KTALINHIKSTSDKVVRNRISKLDKLTANYRNIDNLQLMEYTFKDFEITELDDFLNKIRKESSEIDEVNKTDKHLLFVINISEKDRKITDKNFYSLIRVTVENKYFSEGRIGVVLSGENIKGIDRDPEAYLKYNLYSIYEGLTDLGKEFDLDYNFFFFERKRTRRLNYWHSKLRKGKINRRSIKNISDDSEDVEEIIDWVAAT
ncbi:MAG: hypothetical protein MRY83_10380, partial [Flavobacteriales bacterium]|nr:hypothetical protein [Flavobacteriales bacterium]